MCAGRHGKRRVGYRSHQGKTMKEGIHPNYREVVFQDMSNGFKFITRSTIQTRENIELDGKTYPLAKIEVSSESHSFYTGQQKIMDTAGRVEKFKNKFGVRANGKAK
jgi:large subunit ribosomal protein L31